MTRNPIDYARLADALLQRIDSLLEEWLPAGQERNGRWYCGDFDGSPGESANVNMATGQWIDNGGGGEDRGGDLISLYARIHNLSNHDAALQLMERLGWISERDEQRRSPVQTPAPDRGGPPALPDEPPEASEGDAPREPRKKREPKWRPIVPVPRHANQPKFRFGFKNKKTGTYDEFDAVRTWAYRMNGQLLGHVARFERVDSRGELVKDTVPLTWCENVEDDRGGQRWHWKVWDDPRPLYVPAEGIVPQLPVVVVEGEKCAEEAHKLLGTEFTFVSWPGGCKTWAKADWSWLKGLTVYLWADVDHQHERLTKAEREAGVDPKTKPELHPHKQPGMVAMLNVGTELQAKQGCKVYLCPVLGLQTQKDGWDVADAIEEGWTAERLRDFIRSSPEFVSPNDEARAMAKQTPSGAGAGEGEGESLAWRDKLLRSSTGAIKAVRENAVLALDGLPDKGISGAPEAEGVIAFDEFSNNVIKLKATPWGTDAGVWQEEDELEMGSWLARSLYLPPMPRGTLEEATLMVAKRHKVHPVRQAIESLRGTHDGVKRLGTWLERVCMKDKEVDPELRAYLARAGAWFVMAMCARVLTPQLRGGEVLIGPGCKFDYMLIFEGPQGWGKSTIAKILGGDYYADTGLILGEKDSYQNIQGIHVYEWGELDSMSKADVKLVKLFIASAKDRFRATFDRRPRDYPRQVVFVGTTNEDHYMTDATGNRRFWPVKLLAPADLDWLRENRAQLLAEALVWLDAGERFHPTIAEQRKYFDPQQQARMVENSIDSLIRDYLYNADQKVPHMGENGTLVNQISLTTLLSRIGYSNDKQTDVVVKKAGQTMSRLGWTTTRPAADSSGHRPRVYVRPDSERPGWVVTPARASSGPDSPAQGNQPTEASNGCPV